MTVASMTPQRYQMMYDETRGNHFSKFHGYAYDGIWVIAHALDSIIRQNGGVYESSDFRGNRLQATLNDTDFVGVTGRVSFKDGDRVGTIMYKQFQNGRMVKVGEYDAHEQMLDFWKGHALLWHGTEFPRDRSLVERRLQHVNMTLYVTMCFLASLGIVLAIFFLVINIRFRHHRYIKMSSPNLNNLIIFGCFLSYISIMVLGTDGGRITPANFPAICATRSWVLSIGFTLGFGAMFSKTWRVHVIFTNIKMHRKVVKDYQLFILVAVLLLVDIVILGAWQLFDPLKRRTKELKAKVDGSRGDVEVIPVIESCVSEYASIWLSAIYAYKGLLLVFGCFLAWETRNVNLPALNDSKYIGMSVYNIVIMCVSGVPISFIINDRLDANFLIIGLFIIFCTTITLCLVFVPKVIQLRRDPLDEERIARIALHKAKSKKKKVPTATLR